MLTADTIARLADDHGLAGLEVDHQDHDACRPRRRCGRSPTGLGLIVTGSSDHHGLGKTDHELGCNTTAPGQFEALLDGAEGEFRGQLGVARRGVPAVSSIIDLALLSEVFITLFVIMDPPGTVPVFISLTAGQSRAVRRRRRPGRRCWWRSG